MSGNSLSQSSLLVPPSTEGRQPQDTSSLEAPDPNKILAELISDIEPTDPAKLAQISRLYQLFNEDVGFSSQMPQLVSTLSTTIGNTPGTFTLSADEVVASLETSGVSQQIESIEIHSPDKGNDSGVVVVWFRQSHAESGRGAGGEFVSGISADSVENQKAIFLVGESLARSGVRFFGLENHSSDYNYSLQEELAFADRNFDFSDNNLDQVVNMINGTAIPNVYAPGLLALHSAYPLLDVVGVDGLRSPLRENGLAVEAMHINSNRGLSELADQIPDDPHAMREFIETVKKLPHGVRVLESLLGQLKTSYSFFSLYTDQHGLDSVGAALMLQTFRMDSQLGDQGFQRLQEAKGKYAANVAAIQYGALHTGLIEKARDSGLTIVDVIPRGVDLGQFDETSGLHQMAQVSNAAIARYIPRIKAIERALSE